jgi:hypothetical protein
MCHRIVLDPEARDPALAAFDQRRARAAEGIEHPLTALDRKSIEIFTDEMRRKRKHETVPIVHRSIGYKQAVGVGGHDRVEKFSSRFGDSLERSTAGSTA